MECEGVVNGTNFTNTFLKNGTKKILMATANVVLKKDYKRKDGTYPLKIKLKAGQKTVYYNTDFI